MWLSFDTVRALLLPNRHTQKITVGRRGMRKAVEKGASLLKEK